MEPIEPANPHDLNEQTSRQNKLDTVRIRQVLLIRRAALRFRSYFLIAALTSVVLGVDLLWRAVRRFVLFGFEWRSVIYLAIAAFLAWLSIQMFARARAWGGQARKHTLPEPNTPPDFSTLSDGSQIAKNLEDVQ